MIRQNYLSPLTRMDDARHRAVVRELDITSTGSVKGFDGSSATQHAVARQYGIRVAPTVLFVDARGKLLAEPIVGGDVSGLYGGYLDNRLSEAAKRLAAEQVNGERRGKE